MCKYDDVDKSDLEQLKSVWIINLPLSGSSSYLIGNNVINLRISIAE